MENTENHTQSEQNTLVIDGTIERYLTETAKWTKFISIVGFIFNGLLLLFAFVIIIGASQLPLPFSPYVGVLYIIMAIVYFFPVLYLYQASVKLAKGLKSRDQELLTEGFSYLKTQFKYIGILLIVGIGFYLILFLISMIGILAG